MSTESAINTAYKVYLTILLFGGLFGHIMSAVIFVRFPSLAGPNTRRLFVSLSVADALVLLTAVSRYWIRLFFLYDIRFLSEPACRLHTFLVYLFGDLALWILAAMSAVRLVCILRPTWRAQQTSRVFVPLLLSALFLVSAARNVVLFFNLGTRTYFDSAPSNSSSNSTSAETDQWVIQCTYLRTDLAKSFRMVDFVMYSVIPCTVLISCNLGLVIALYRLARKTKQQFQTNSKGDLDSQRRSGTVLILVLSAFYLLTNLPTVGFSALPTLGVEVHLDSQTGQLISDYLYMLHYIANGTSGLFYYCFNPTFRHCFNRLITCHGRRGRVGPY